MAAGVTRKISSASARSHTRKAKHKTSFLSPYVVPLRRRPRVIMPFKHMKKGIVKSIIVVFLVGVLALAYQSACPPPPKTCGSPGGPIVSAQRIKLRDGRYLAYKELGLPKDKAKHKIVYVHGMSNCRNDVTIAHTLTRDVIEDLSIYIVSFDRPGYGESDPNPKQTLKTMAFDVEELADQLELGSKFYIVGFSMGGLALWPCLKYIPHRLAGASLIAPGINFWWPGFPANLSTEAYSQRLPKDQWALRVAHYIPWLTYWWNTQKMFPSFATRNPAVFSRQDHELLHSIVYSDGPAAQEHATQQGDYESLHRDLMIAFGNWEFDPMDLENPFPNNQGSVHLWQGDDDKLVPVTLQRYISQRLPWIHYHEISGAGHMFPLAEGMGYKIVKTLITGDSVP